MNQSVEDLRTYLSELDENNLRTISHFDMRIMMLIGNDFLFDFFSNCKDPRFIQYIVKNASNLEVHDGKGYRLINYACLAGDINIVKYLVNSRNVNISHRESNGCSSLLKCACYNTLYEESNGLSSGVMIFNYLLRKGVQLEEKDSATLLDAVIFNSNYSFVKIFLINELSLDCMINEKRAVVHAARNANLDFMKCYFPHIKISQFNKRELIQAAKYNNDHRVLLYLDKFFSGIKKLL